MADKRQRSPLSENLMYHRVNVLWQGIDGWIRWTVVGLGAPILALALVYWGYCWHWWGRDTLALQYLFQCRCPPASEATRYPNFTVLVPACSNPRIHDMSSDGRLLLVENETPPRRIFQINLQTGQQRTLPLDTSKRSSVEHIDDERFFIYQISPGGYSVLDLQNSTQTAISWGYADMQDPQTHDLLENAQEVFVFNNEVLALAEDYQKHTDKNIVLRETSSNAQENLSNQLTTTGIKHQLITLPYQTGRIWDAYYSPDGQFYAKSDGIYRTATNEQLVSTHLPQEDRLGNFGPLGWVAGQRGIVYTAGTAYVIDNSDDYAIPYNWLPVPQPKLLLELPEEFWTE
ncbi:MAG: hypothetical protein AAGF95_29205 [Chloroflexota bacterium]